MTRQDKIQTAQEPRWAMLADRAEDITDAYREVTDPQNIWGETCVAFFDYEAEEVEPSNPYEKCWFENFPKLTGIVINDRHGPSYVGRDIAIRMLGADVVERIEETA